LNLPLHIATRYFFSQRKRGGFNAVTIISYISLLGYAVGAAALFIVLSVFNGFEHLFVGMYSNFDADLRITSAKGKTFAISDLPINQLLATGLINSKTWVWEENALLRYNKKQTIATVKAVDEAYVKTNPLDSHLLRGLLILSEGDTSYAWVGQGLGYQLGVDPDDQFNFLGIYLPRKGKVDMLNPEGAFVHGILFPLAVFGIQEEVDNKYVIIPLKYMQELLEDTNRVSALELRLKNNISLNTGKERIEEMLGENYIVKNRFEQRDSFFKVMQSEKTISYFILVFILLIAAFNTIGSLYMLVIEKKRDLFVFSSLGLTPFKASLIFVWQGLWIALSGGLTGIVLGALVCLGQQKFGWVSLETSSAIKMSAYPVLPKWEDALLVFLTLLVMGFITALYPARKAAQIIVQDK
jgi:lipoprotein-releasing system permease protein